MDILFVLLIMAFGAGLKDAVDKELAKEPVVIEQPVEETPVTEEVPVVEESN